MSNANEPAFPDLKREWQNRRDVYRFDGGLTKRELIAAMAMQGLLASSDERVRARDIANEAVRCTDALILALAAQPSGGVG